MCEKSAKKQKRMAPQNSEKGKIILFKNALRTKEGKGTNTKILKRLKTQRVRRKLKKFHVIPWGKRSSSYATGAKKEGT